MCTKWCILPLILLLSASLALAQTSVSEMPSNLRESIEWVWNNRIVPKSAGAPIGEGSTARQNLIFDQIYDAGGSLNYVVRWQSSQTLSRAQRQGLQTMIQRQINNWTRYLVGFEGWPYGTVPVKIVGWAVDDAALILDPQPGEVIYTTYSYDAVHNQDATIPANLPDAPIACSRFEHFTEASYTYATCPQGAQGRFDMYLWGTANWNGGVGGDWGQRMAETYYLNNLNTDQLTMLEHEIGHGFGITDFYGATERPPNGFPTNLIMWAGNSQTITEWDAWMLRYIWSKLKADQVRFPPRAVVSSSSSSLSSSSSVSSSSLSSSSVSSSSSQTVVCSQVVTPYLRVNGTAWQAIADVSLQVGDTLKLGPRPTGTAVWSWTGPGGYSASTREILFENIQESQQGNYVARYVNGGCDLTQTYDITVTLPTAQLRGPQLGEVFIHVQRGMLEISGQMDRAEILDIHGRQIRVLGPQSAGVRKVAMGSLPKGILWVRIVKGPVVSGHMLNNR